MASAGDGKAESLGGEVKHVDVEELDILIQCMKKSTRRIICTSVQWKTKLSARVQQLNVKVENEMAEICLKEESLKTLREKYSEHKTELDNIQDLMRKSEDGSEDHEAYLRSIESMENDYTQEMNSLQDRLEKIKESSSAARVKLEGSDSKVHELNLQVN